MVSLLPPPASQVETKEEVKEEVKEEKKNGAGSYHQSSELTAQRVCGP